MIDVGETLYLELIKKVLTNVIYEDPPIDPWSGWAGFTTENRELGMDWPSLAHTMSGLHRLNNMHECLRNVVADDVPGDFIETGVWRGGMCIFMRAFLKAYGIKDRTIWVADSFEGMPEVGIGGHTMDHQIALHRSNGVLGVSVDQVKANFAKYDLLDDQVRFLPGWFRDTLPTAPVEQLAVLRLDGDLYESTKDALNNLYPKLSPRGYLIVDDYGIAPCRKALHEYRDEHGITEPLQRIDLSAVYWRREI